MDQARDDARLRELAAILTGAEIYWGSHGCKLERGHDGPHLCECAGRDVFEEDGAEVGAPPYYGPETRFWGEDVEEPARG